MPRKQGWNTGPVTLAGVALAAVIAGWTAFFVLTSRVYDANVAFKTGRRQGRGAVQ